MKLTVNVSKTTASKAQKDNHTVVFCDNNGKVLGKIDKALNEQAKRLIDKANFNGNVGESVSDFALDGGTSLSVVGVGKSDKLASHITKIAKTTYQAIQQQQTATIVWGDTICQKHFGQFANALLGNHYRFDTYKNTDKKSSKKDSKKTALSHIQFVNNKDDIKDYDAVLTLTKAIVPAQNLARTVANEPPNVCTPSHMAKQAKQLAKDYGDLVKVTVLDEKKMHKLGMGCFLAVSQGSDNEGKIAIIEYFGKSKKDKKLAKPIALVGKGVTFDSGGISLKPSSGMDEMKFDMGGAAAMLGVAKGLCEAKLPLDVVIVLALAENMPSGHACRPGDIVTAMDGTTVEILNTDAEGRLVLADALCYVQDTYKPSTIIDAATLTGACVIALGGHRSGLYSNDEDTLFAIENASEQSGDLVWHMPLGDDYAKELKSPFADLQNIGSGKGGGSITAACFLQHFIKNDTPWVHLDIAGTAWTGGDNKGATGRPVPLLMHYLHAQSQQAPKLDKKSRKK